MAGDLSNWQPCPLPGDKEITGALVRLEPYEASKHAASLHELLCTGVNRKIWEYIPFGPFDQVDDFRAAYEMAQQERGWLPMVIIALGDDHPLGMYSFMRLRPEAGSVEIGAVLYSNKLQRTREGTEAFYLGARHVFEDCGYRRYEWKCNSRNEPSRRAAMRYGFTHEGRFRQDMVVKGENRDTDWYSMLDHEWPLCGKALKAWLNERNFDQHDHQRHRLEQIREELAEGTGKK